MIWRCDQGCQVDPGWSNPDPSTCLLHNLPYRYIKALGSKQSDPASGGRRRSTPKQKAISPASPEQRAKVKDALSIISGKTPCDPMHLWDRRLGGCDDALCVVPATRLEHREYEEKRLDILPALVAGGYFAEMAHVIAEHRVSPTVLVERLTGQKYGPLAPLERRIAELEHELEAVSARG